MTPASSALKAVPDPKPPERRKGGAVIPDRLRNALLIVITTVWVVNFGAALVVPDYNPSESINAVFTVIVGALFALGNKKSSGKDDEQDQ